MTRRKWEKWSYSIVTACAVNPDGVTLYQDFDAYAHMDIWVAPNGVTFDEEGIPIPFVNPEREGGPPAIKLGEFDRPEFKETA